jgi:hypothetical protein
MNGLAMKNARHASAHAGVLASRFISKIQFSETQTTGSLLLF